MAYCPKCWYPITVQQECYCDLCGWFGDPREILAEPGREFNLTHTVIRTLELYRGACREEMVMEHLYGLGNATEKDLQHARILTRNLVHSLIEMFVKLKVRPNIPQETLFKLPSGFIPYPETWEKHYNSNEPCDMLIGPCTCGAFHRDDEEWVQTKLIEHQAVIV